MCKFFSLYPYFIKDSLSNFVVLAIGLFTLLTLIYSSKFMKGKEGLLRYYTYIILTAIASIGAVRSNNLILLFVFWGFLGLTLYLLINMGEKTSTIAKKTFIIIGASDALMLLGIAIIYNLSGTFQMDAISLNLDNSSMSIIAYLCMALACFAKAGAMPMHSWIPESAEKAPLPVVAFLPASLDKLLGIYLLARLSLDLFVMNQAMNTFLMIVGAITIIAAVMMALVQHNMKKLLGYHAVSQVGYMVLGIGTGIPIGIAGGIFHMLNNAIYKSCLFFTAGNVEHRMKTTELNRLGGLASLMPVTYIACLIASLSISGVPPFNGFVSKWMVYQGLVQRLSSESGGSITAICLVAAMFGSGLTLASFMKLIHATFLGQRIDQHKAKVSEVSWPMWLPCVILALICIIFGVFANQLPLKYFILPSVGEVSFLGVWYARLASLMILVGFIVGILIFRFKGLTPNFREDSSFTGGEPITAEIDQNRVTGTEFYNTIKDIGILRAVYKKAEAGVFDIYEQLRKATFLISGFLRYLHNGILPTYLVWCLLGMIGIFYLLVFK
ncbi:MAG: proton-conducting transporter membrane subunit [Candidatus Omnitrophota bacterium]